MVVYVWFYRFIESCFISSYYYIVSWMYINSTSKTVRWNDFGNKTHLTYSKEDYDRTSWTSLRFRY